MAAKKVPLLRRMLTARGRSLEITRAGKLFILVTLAVGFAAINSGSNLLHVIFGAQMAMIIGSGILSEQAVRRIEATRRPGSSLHAETRAAVVVEMHNTARRGDVLSVSVEDDDRFEDQGESAPVFAVRVPPRGTIQLHSTVTMPRRGLHPLPRAVVSTRFPFGLFVKRRELPAPPPVLVYPRVHPVDNLPAGLAAVGEADLTGKVARVGEFHGLREFREGDDMRRIHWPATARMKTPVVREHEGHGDREIVLPVPTGRSGDPEFEDAIEAVASRCLHALRTGALRVGLREGSRVVVEPGSGPQQEHRILGHLALVGAEAAA